MPREERYAIKKFSEKPLEGANMYSETKVQTQPDQLTRREQIVYDKHKEEAKKMPMKDQKNQKP